MELGLLLNVYISYRVYFSQYDDWYEGFGNNADYFTIEIDSRHNHKSSYGFAINSSGIQADYELSDDGNSINDDWNAQWYSAVSIQDNGWSIECKIPWKILRYSDNDIMGIKIKKLNEIKYQKNMLLLQIQELKNG